MKKGDYVKVVKLSDDVFNGDHPNMVYAGMTVYGILVDDLVEGCPLQLTRVSGAFSSWFHTSTVTKIQNENTFKTRNSTYHIEIIKDL